MSEHFIDVSGGKPYPEVHFRCAAPVNAWCHQYPNCGCEDGRTHDEEKRPECRPVDQTECLLTWWFEGQSWDDVAQMYEADTENPLGEMRGGDIEITYYDVEEVSWEWAS